MLRKSNLRNKCLLDQHIYLIARLLQHSHILQISASCPTRPTRNPLSTEPRHITVRLKRGAWEIEITSPEDRVQQAVESVLAGMASKEPALVDNQEVGPDKQRFETCRGLIVMKWREGWFSTPRALSEAHEEMSRRGFHYDRTAVSHTLADLVREGTLFREGSMRNYRYVQKYPVSGIDTSANAQSRI